MGLSLNSVLAVGFQPVEEWGLQSAWLKAGLKSHLQFAADSRRAVASLAIPKQVRPIPGLILLNLDGNEPNCMHVVHWARRQFALRELMIMVCTANCSDEMVKEAYAKGADRCVTKTGDFSDVMQILQRVECYWYSAPLGKKAA